MDRNRKIQRIRDLMATERIDGISDPETRERVRWNIDQAAKVIRYKPLEEMHPTSLQVIYNALDHCEAR